MKEIKSDKLFPKNTFTSNLVWPPSDFQRMGKIWRIGINGNNHWSVGHILPGNYYSERFNPESPYYQAWVGMYAVDKDLWGFDSKENPSLNKQIELAIKDQNAWLQAYGAQPFTKSLSVFGSRDAEVNGHKAKIFFVELESRSDVGNKNNPNIIMGMGKYKLGRNEKYTKALIPPVYLDNKTLKELGQKDMNRIYRLRALFQRLGPYHLMKLYTIYVVWSCPFQGKTFCAYACTGGINDAAGRSNFSRVEREFLNILLNIKCH